MVVMVIMVIMVIMGKRKTTMTTVRLPCSPTRFRAVKMPSRSRRPVTPMMRQSSATGTGMQGLDKYFGDVVVPKEQVTEFKGGKKRVVWRKLYPGYILVNMLLNDDTWYLVRETGGIGDFTGSAGRPSPMLPQDVAKLLNKAEVKADEAPRLKIAFKKGDRVKINEGTFENFEGEVEEIDEANGRVTVMLSIFGRSTPVDIEYWQIESV